MAKNTGQGYRKGQVTGRSQFRSAGSWRKRDTVTGRIIATAKEPFKGVRRER